MTKQHSSVSELIHSISSPEDKEFIKTLNSEIQKRKISSCLAKIRNSKHLSMDDLAKKANVPISKINKIENTVDENLKMGDILLYTKALGMKIDMFFLNKDTIMVERVKYHYFRLKALIDKIIDISKGDAAMELAAYQFSQEAFYNVSSGLLECMNNAERKLTSKEPQLTLSASPEETKIIDEVV